MPEIVYTQDGHPIRHVRVVPGSWITTPGGYPVQAIRIIEPPSWPANLLYTPSGLGISTVRLVDAGGLYTTDRGAISSVPEDPYTPDGHPIRPVRIFSSVPSPEVMYTGDGYYIQPVRLADAAGLIAPADSDLTSWMAAVISNGGTVSPAYELLVNSFIAAEKAAGTWALTDDYWLLWADNAPAALTSLKQRRLASAVAAPGFLPGQGYNFNGTTNYLNTGFAPGTHGAAMSGGNLRAAVWELTNSSGNYSIGGQAAAASNSLGLRARSGSLISANFNSSSVGSVSTVASSIGYSAASRPGGVVLEFYQHGVQVASGAPPGTTTVVQTTQPLYIGANNLNGVAASFRNTVIGMAAVGAALTPAQEAAQYANVRAMAVSLNVIFQSETTDWVTSVLANGGQASLARQKLINEFIVAEKAAGTWALTDDYWILAAEDAPQSLTSLKQRRLATVTNAPAFIVDRGYTFDGATNFINTGFSCRTHGVAIAANDLRIAVYERTDVAVNVTAGVTGSGSSALWIAGKDVTTLVSRPSASSNCFHPLPVADSRGWSAGSLRGDTTDGLRAYKNGVALAPPVTPPASLFSLLPSNPIYVGAANNQGTAQFFRAASVGMVAVGAALSGTQEAAQYANVRTLVGAIGATLLTAETRAWRDQVVSNSGTVSIERLEAVDQFIRAEMAAGTWALTDDYWALWGENAPQALTSLKQLRLAAPVAAPLFTADLGYTFDGATQYISSGFIAATHGVALGNDNVRYAAYERTELSSSSQTSMGGSSGLFFNQLITRQPTGVQVRLNTSAAILFTLPAASNLGYAAGSRNGTTVASVKAFKNGVELAFASGAPTFNSGRLAVTFNIGAFNGSGTPTAFRATSTSFACVGAALTPAQELAQYNNVQTFAAAVGAALFSAEAIAWRDQVVVNGGTVSNARLNIVDQFIRAEIAAGTWALTDDYWPLWGENAVQSLTSLKQRRLATAIAAPVLTPDRGYQFNATTQHLDTGFIPASHAVALTITSARLATYSRNNIQTSSYTAGAGVSATNLIALRPHTSAVVMQGSAMFGAGQWTVADSLGYSAVSRNGAVPLDTFAYRNGVALVRVVDPATTGTIMPTFSLIIGGLNLNGVITFGPYDVGFACIGGALTPAQEIAQYNNVQAWATAIGAQV